MKKEMEKELNDQTELSIRKKKRVQAHKQRHNFISRKSTGHRTRIFLERQRCGRGAEVIVRDVFTAECYFCSAMLSPLLLPR